MLLKYNNMKSKKTFSDINIFGRNLSLTQKSLIAKHMSVMLKSGLTLTDSLNTTAQSASPKVKKILSRVSASVEAGHKFSDALMEYPKIFSGVFFDVVQAGEKSGTLSDNLENLSVVFGKEKELRSKIFGAMVYPTVVILMTLSLGFILSFVVLPKITPLFEGLKVDLPVTTEALIWFSNFMETYGIFFLFIFVGLILFSIWILRLSFSKKYTHWIILRIPFIKDISISTNIARFSRTSGLLLKSGFSIDEALDMASSTVENYYYRKALTDVSYSVRLGSLLYKNLENHRNLFPVIVTRMISVGEESGQFEETFFYLSEFYEAEVDAKTKVLSTVIEPILLILVGLTVGFLALSIITPIYDITGNIQR